MELTTNHLMDMCVCALLTLDDTFAHKDVGQLVCRVMGDYFVICSQVKIGMDIKSSDVQKEEINRTRRKKNN